MASVGRNVVPFNIASRDRSDPEDKSTCWIKDVQIMHCLPFACSDIASNNIVEVEGHIKRRDLMRMAGGKL